MSILSKINFLPVVETKFSDSKMLKTRDDWYGNYGENKDKVEVSFLVHYYNNWMVRIAFWGNDDTGIVKDQYFSFDEIKDLKKAIKKMWREYNSFTDYVSRDKLLQNGYTWF